MSYCQNVLPRADMNGDHVYTISDLWLQIKTVYLLPANFLVDTALPTSPVARFLELDCWSAHGFVGAILAGYLWWLAIMIVGSILMGAGKATQK